ncbi:acyl-CoA thioesterase [Mycobacterium parmense]|uniref:Uncharacterized protein n=1 Tax=Mycobacterium parmense TaxID=185642 RepID=A0A7I7YXW5_9MYCO|nr:acyl-CoA thioesterase [Mycobacterium parmense]MCV7352711.1 acyl-CoA thioesterase [Mycobacterium parmense]ORW54626.1 hypothetical protein AWC20_19205 [Mycobacterium parmense]BBZ46718.1 hypothetical protein MPRM_39990 [Mycobacterium parmense]
MKPSIRLLKILTAPPASAHHEDVRPSAEDPQAQTVTRWRVLPCDIDLFGHMNNSRYALMMDFARVHYLRRAGLLTVALKQRWVIPVSAVALEFHRPLKPFQRFEISTQVLSWDDRWLFMRQTFQTREGPVRPVATGYVKTIIRSPAGSVAPAQLARLVCGRDVDPPALPDELWARFRTPPRATSREPHASEGKRLQDVSRVDVGLRRHAVAR